MKSKHLLILSQATFVILLLLATAQAQETYDYENTLSLDGVAKVAVSGITGTVTIMETLKKNEEFTLRILAKGDDASERLKVSQDDNQVTISEHKLDNDETVVVSDSGNVVIAHQSGQGNQHISINGKTLDSTINPIDLTLYLPQNTSLKLHDLHKVNSQALLNEVELTTKGAGTYAFKAINDLKLNGTGVLKLKVSELKTLTGNLTGAGNIAVSQCTDCVFTLDLSGACRFLAEGSFTSLDLKASGASRMNTTGPVLGSFTAEASGASKIQHTGSITGKISKKTSGASTIKIHSPPS